MGDGSPSSSEMETGGGTWGCPKTSKVTASRSQNKSLGREMLQTGIGIPVPQPKNPSPSSAAHSRTPPLGTKTSPGSHAVCVGSVSSDSPPAGETPGAHKTSAIINNGTNPLRLDVMAHLLLSSLMISPWCQLVVRASATAQQAGSEGSTSDQDLPSNRQLLARNSTTRARPEVKRILKPDRGVRSVWLASRVAHEGR
jgi:hypothetical protein